MTVPAGHRAIHQLAERQLGVVSRQQLTTLDAGSGLISHWLASGRLLRIFRGVYAFGRLVRSNRSMWMAATLRGGPESLLSGESAAAAWGMIEPGRRIEVCRPNGHLLGVNSSRPHQGYHLVIRSKPLAGPDRTKIGPIPIVVPARVLIGLAGDSTPSQLRRAFVGAGTRGLLTRECLEYISSRGASFKGHGRLMELVDQWLPDTGRLRSPLEAEFLLLCGRYGIPAPRTNHWIGGYEADCFWPGTRVIVELDSRTFHDHGIGFETDRDKGNDLSLSGYVVLRYTYRMVTRQPEKVARNLRKHLERAAEPSVG